MVDLSYLGGLVVREQQLLLLDGLSLVELFEALVDLALLPSCGHPLRGNTRASSKQQVTSPAREHASFIKT